MDVLERGIFLVAFGVGIVCPYISWTINYIKHFSDYCFKYCFAQV